MLGVSTALRSEIAQNGREVIEAILDLGLEAVELEYRITRPMLQEILPLLQKRRVQAISLHSYFPLPEEVPREKASGDVFSLCSPDKEERNLAVKYTIQTMEWAEELEVPAIVVHMGKLSGEGSMAALKKLYDQKKIQTEEGKEFIQERVKIRTRDGQLHLDPALRSLDKLSGEAEKRGIFLGLENRYNLHDFPNLEEFKVIFREFNGSMIRYWHDLGHATAQQNLGLESQEKLLANFGHLLIGVHLHGCRGYDDHKAPGAGEEDYALLKKFLKPETRRVVETHHRATREEVIKGLAFLREQGVG